MRTASVLEPWPQGKVERHSGIGYELVQALDAPMLQMVEQLPDVLHSSQHNHNGEAVLLSKVLGPQRPFQAQTLSFGLSAEWGRGVGVRGGDGGLAGLRLQRVVVGLFLRLWTSLRPCRLSSSSLRCTRGWCLRSSSSTSALTSCVMVAYTHSANCALPLRSHRCCSWCLCAVVMQRLVPGRCSADYCEGSAVAVL